MQELLNLISLESLEFINKWLKNCLIIGYNIPTKGERKEIMIYYKLTTDPEPRIKCATLPMKESGNCPVFFGDKNHYNHLIQRGIYNRNLTILLK